MYVYMVHQRSKPPPGHRAARRLLSHSPTDRNLLCYGGTSLREGTFPVTEERSLQKRRKRSPWDGGAFTAMKERSLRCGRAFFVLKNCDCFFPLCLCQCALAGLFDHGLATVRPLLEQMEATGGTVSLRQCGARLAVGGGLEMIRASTWPV